VPESSQATNIQFIFEHFVTPASAPIWAEWIQRVIINVRSYQYELGGMILVPFPLNLIREPSDVFVGIVFVLNAVKGWTGLVFLPLLALGIWTDLRTSTTAVVRLLFMTFYAAIILLYPLQDIRFFLPALPFVLIWSAIGLGTILNMLPRGRSAVGGVVVALLVLLNAAAVVELLASNRRYRAAVEDDRSGRSPFHMTGYYATPWELAGEALVASTGPEIVIASASKEIVPFVGGRKVLEVNRAVPLPMFESMLRRHDVQVLLAQQVRSGIRSHEIQISESRRFQFDTIATAGWLTVYRVRYRLREGLSPRHTDPDPFNGILSLLHEGRRSIHGARYREADSVLALAQRLDPVNAEIAFQRVAASALSGSFEEAVAAQQRLFSTPRSTSYTPPGRVLLSMAQALNAARADRPGVDRAHWYFQASRMAWDLGYPEQAEAFADSALAVDPRHFESLLWSMHYRFQSGDSTRARRDLALLRSLDAENPVVRGFGAMDSLSRLMSRSPDRAQQARLALEISRVYEQIGLPEEALDMTDRAWMALPREAQARAVEIRGTR
jgi:tetratricopeptide (TPR) repeat protein